jgi:predicted DsbA family dithiol-disulfide isomerase
VWRSFELDPSAPAQREGDPTERLAAKYGMSREQALASHDRVTRLAAQEGLSYRLEKSRSGNTFNAHRLLHLSHERGVQDALKERFMLAYFTESVPIGDTETLVRLAAEAGISESDARAVLATDAYTDDVRADETEARELGISGVPFFVIDRRYGVSGAQPADVLLQVLDRAWAEAYPSLVLAPVGAVPDEAACTDDTCAT